MNSRQQQQQQTAFNMQNYNQQTLQQHQQQQQQMLNAQLRSQVLLLKVDEGLYSGKGSEQVLKLSLAADLCSTLQSGIIIYSWKGSLFWEME